MQFNEYISMYFSIDKNKFQNLNYTKFFFFLSNSNDFFPNFRSDYCDLTVF